MNRTLHQSRKSALEDLVLDLADREDVMAVIPEDCLGWLIYGSVARGDSGEASDIDVIAIVPGVRRSQSKGRVNVTYYTAEKLFSASGTIFGEHLRTDSRIIDDPEGIIDEALGSFSPPDISTIMTRLRRIAVAIKDVDEADLKYLDGLVRLSRYLLRTALYASAVDAGTPCFSVRELAQLHADPSLVTILSSHPQEQRPASLDLLMEIRSRLLVILGDIDTNPYQSLEGLIIGSWEDDPDTANSVLLAIGRSSEEIPYNEIPRVVL